MNGWLLVALIVVIVALVIFLGSLVAIIGPVKKTLTILMVHVKNIQRQVEGVQTEVTTLTATIDRINADVQFKKEAVQSVVISTKAIGTNFVALKDSSEQATLAVVRRTNQDEHKQAEVEAWKNTALSMLKRYA